MRRFAVLIIGSGVVLLVLTAVCTTPPSTPPSTPTPTATPMPPTPTPVPTPTPSPLPTQICLEPNDEGIGGLLEEFKSCRPDISEDTRDLVDLLVMLEGFRRDPEFHQVGFGVCCRFNAWMKEAELLNDRAEISSLVEIGLAPGDVIQVGLEYLRSAGQPTEYTDYMMSVLELTVREAMGLEQSPSVSTSTVCSTPDMVLGEWINQLTNILSQRITIFCNRQGQWQTTSLFNDGSRNTSDLLENQSPIGRRFDIVDNAWGEYFIVDSKGNLQIWDSLGLITTAKKVGP